MKSTPTPRPLPLLLALALALPARADTVAVHPCAVSSSKDRTQLEKLRSVCQEELERLELLLAPSQSQVGALLAKAKGGSCARFSGTERERCLGRLAEATQASLGLLVTLEPGDALLNVPWLATLLVDAKGNYVQAGRFPLTIPIDPSAPNAPTPPPEELLRLKVRELRKLLPQLQRVMAPATPPAPEPAPIANASQPPAGQPPAAAQTSTQAQPEAGTQPATSPQAQASAPPLPEQASPAAPALAASTAGSSPWATWRKPTTYASLGAGAAAAGVALFFALRSEDNMRQAINGFNAAAQGRPDGVPVFPSESALQEQVGRYHQAALNERLAAGISTGLSAALLGVGAWLWFTEPTPPTPGTASLMVGPGSVGVRVLTP